MIWSPIIYQPARRTFTTEARIWVMTVKQWTSCGMTFMMVSSPTTTSQLMQSQPTPHVFFQLLS